MDNPFYLLITVRNVVAVRLYFQRHLSFCSLVGVYLSMHWADTHSPLCRHPMRRHPPGKTPPRKTPLGRHTPPGRQPPWADTQLWADTPLPSSCWDTHPLPSAGYTPCPKRPLQWTVRILLEYILVGKRHLATISCNIFGENKPMLPVN